MNLDKQVKEHEDSFDFHKEQTRETAFKVLDLLKGYIEAVQEVSSEIYALESEVRDADSGEKAKKCISNHILSKLEDNFSIEGLQRTKKAFGDFNVTRDIKKISDNFLLNCRKLELFLHKCKKTDRSDKGYQNLLDSFQVYSKKGLYARSVVVFKEMTLQAKMLRTYCPNIEPFYEELQRISNSIEEYENT